MELKRKIDPFIEKWYRENKKNALLIKGARQVGKTHEIRSELKALNCSYVEINLIEKPEMIDLLRSFTTIDEFIMNLSTVVNIPIMKGETVIFIDEIQQFKEMVTKIKFLVDEGSFRYILSGSLLGVEITNLASAPVGYLTTYEMFPLDFEEFLQITNITDDIVKNLYECFEKRHPVSEIIHNKLLALFNQYLVVGGMPEAVSKFAESHNLNDVITIHKNIFDQYKLDFTKYETEDKRLIISNVYDLIPAELLKQNRRFIVSDIKAGLHYERVQSSFLWLKNAGVVLTVFNATEPRIPLKLNEKQSLFKMYLSDVGMLTSFYGMNAKSKILRNDNSLNGGGIYENSVAQALICNGFNTYYYNSNRLGELDFVIEYEGRTVPIEVKSGKDYTIHSALNHCLDNPEYRMEEAFVFANSNIYKNGKITYFPIYMAGFIRNDLSDNYIVEEITF